MLSPRGCAGAQQLDPFGGDRARVVLRQKMRLAALCTQLGYLGYCRPRVMLAPMASSLTPAAANVHEQWVCFVDVRHSLAWQ